MYIYIYIYTHTFNVSRFQRFWRVLADYQINPSIPRYISNDIQTRSIFNAEIVSNWINARSAHYFYDITNINTTKYNSFLAENRGKTRNTATTFLTARSYKFSDKKNRLQARPLKLKVAKQGNRGILELDSM